MRNFTLFIGAAAAIALASPAAAADHVVKMLNKGGAGMFVFEPALVRIVQGDTVTFIPVDKFHNAESIAGMIPDGAVAFKGTMSQPLKVTFSKPGLYGYKCLPHYGLGMVGMVIVGNAGNNLAAAQKISQPGKAKQAFAGLFAQAGVRTAAR